MALHLLMVIFAVMKNFSTILAVLFLILAVTPCSDGTNKEDLHLDELSSNHDHGPDNDDSCPSTCICNCCGMSITYQAIETYELKIYPKISTQVIATYQPIYRFDFLYNIWQPPQLIS
jgi:hypothetical protein